MPESRTSGLGTTQGLARFAADLRYEDLPSGAVATLAGGLRADLRFVLEPDDAGVYKRLLATPQFQPLITKTYPHANRTKVGLGHFSGYSIAASELLSQFVGHRPGGYASLTIIALYESPGNQ
jgi:hypothetical protein